MIRVLRLLEYTFESPADAEDHFGRLGVPANGTFRLQPGRRNLNGVTIRSAIITDFDARTKIEVTDVSRPGDPEHGRSKYPVTVRALLNLSFVDEPDNFLIQGAEMGTFNLNGPEDSLVLNLLANRDGTLHLEVT